MALLPPARTQPCILCGKRGSNRHERVPRGRGGPRDSFNTVILCGSGTTGCHGWVTEHPEDAERILLSIPGHFINGRYVGPDSIYRGFYNGERWDGTDWVTP